ncbi:DUF3558 domain-containing protein [Rhodococcus sp. NPDC059234]|uniref:DUF3558 domain-containing protein n=1 Tax=Rhodococcus sp. NPDC059234 TaxID=3346781 RepID=UPI00366CAD50
MLVIGVVGAGLLLAGCGSGETDGKADAAGAAGEPVFSPCDDIPDDAVTAIGVDPATQSRDILGVKQPGWNICGWSGQRYSVSVFATNYKLQDVRSNSKNEEFADVVLGGRVGVQYRDVADSSRENCDVAVESGGGAVLVSVGFHVLTKPRDAQEPCDVAVQTARTLLPVIPE